MGFFCASKFIWRGRHVESRLDRGYLRIVSVGILVYYPARKKLTEAGLAIQRIPHVKCAHSVPSCRPRIPCRRGTHWPAREQTR